MARRMPTPAQAAEKWRRNTAAAADAYKEGVDSVDTAPGEQAAAAVDRYAEGVMQAVQDGRYVEGVRSVSLSEWKDAAKNKGAARLASGAQAAKPKTQAAMERNFANIDRVRQSLPPRGDLEANIQRAVMFARGMREAARGSGG